MRMQPISEPSFRVGAYLRENCLLSHNAAAKLEEERNGGGKRGTLCLSLSEIALALPSFLPSGDHRSRRKYGQHCGWTPNDEPPEFARPPHGSFLPSLPASSLPSFHGNTAPAPRPRRYGCKFLAIVNLVPLMHTLPAPQGVLVRICGRERVKVSKLPIWWLAMSHCLSEIPIRPKFTHVPHPSARSHCMSRPRRRWRGGREGGPWSPSLASTPPCFAVFGRDGSNTSISA